VAVSSHNDAPITGHVVHHALGRDHATLIRRLMTLRNRLVQSPIFTQYATTWGEASRKLIEYHRARARGGIGLIILENTSIDWEVGRTVGNPARLDHDRFRTALGELTEAVHNEGGRFAAQLHHTGRQNTRANSETGEAPISASDGPASA